MRHSPSRWRPVPSSSPTDKDFAMSIQQLPRPRGNKRTLIIGFDFGTHSSKVVLRERGTPDGRIARFDDFAEGYPLFASPSLVRQVGDKLYFGTTALKASGGNLYSSLKVMLLSNADRSVGPSPDKLDNTSLVAAYLAWAFHQIRNSLTDEKYANEFLNMAAPMSHFEDPDLKATYLRIVQAAWKLTFEEQAAPIEQGISVAEVGRLLGPFMVAHVQGSEQRRFDVLPETIAPVVSLSLDPWMEPGMYMIVDTGAGTTEMSVFHVGEAGVDQKVLCYRDETMLLGGNDLQLVEQLTGSDRATRLDRIISRLRKQYGRIWHLGYEMDAPNHRARRRWKELRLVLSGGGTRHVAVSEELADVNPMHPWPVTETKLRVCRHTPGTLELDGIMGDDDGSLFAVANGLAIERKHWPIMFQPNQIEPLEAAQQVESKPKGYWYLDAR